MMPDRSARAAWIETVGLGLLSALFFRFGLLLIVFLLPIQFAWVRRGPRAGLAASGTLLAVLAVLKGFDYLRVADQVSAGAGLLFLDMVLPVGFLVGLYLLNTPDLKIRWGDSVRPLREQDRFIGTLVAAVVVYTPAIVLVHLSGATEILIEAQVELLRSLFTAANATEEEIVALSRLVLRVFLSGFLLAYLIMLVGSWWVGTRLASRGRLAPRESNDVVQRLSGLRLTRFRMPVAMVWVLIGTLGLLVLTLVTELAWVEFVVMNALLVTLAFYAFQGLAILWAIMERRKASRGARMGLAVGLGIGLLIPGLNLVFLLGLPGLGVSEVWVNYHRFDRSGDEQ